MDDDGKANRSNGSSRKNARAAASERYNKLASSSKSWNEKVERTVKKARKAGRRSSAV